VNLYRNGVVLFGVVFIGIGVTMVVVTALHGFGVGLLLGPLFALLGAARIYLAVRKR
jgi:hypothetical protein